MTNGEWGMEKAESRRQNVENRSKTEVKRICPEAFPRTDPIEHQKSAEEEWKNAIQDVSGGVPMAVNCDEHRGTK